MALALSVPAQEKNSLRGLEIRPKQAREWIESLPLTRTMESARAVYEHLSLLNRAVIPAEERMALGEIYHPVLGTLLDELEHVFAYNPLPLSYKQREALDLARGLALETACLYKHFIVETTSKLLAFGAKKSLPLPIFRAMRSLHRVLLQSYMIYHPAPAGVWLELNQMYAYCEQEGLLDEAPDASVRLSLLDVYAIALVLSLSDPYRLMQREVEKVRDLLEHSPGLVALITQLPEGVSADKLYSVALDADRAPRLLSLELKDRSGQALRALDLSRLCEHMQERLDTSSGNREALSRSRATHDTADLIGRLLRLWSDPPKRQFRRNPAENVVAVCSGIKAIVHFSALAEEEKPDLEKAAIRSGDTVPLLRIPDDPLSKRIGVEKWLVLNQSPSGLRLHNEPGGAVGVTVGEVVGVRFAGTRAWNIGVVRWLNLLAGNELEFGLEFIASGAHPVQIEPTIASNGRVQDALKLPPILESEGEKLLTPADTFSDLREYEISDAAGSKLVRATTLLEKTSSFDLFQFTPS
jgi:hypothetical protein